jgi:hypothetical protein
MIRTDDTCTSPARICLQPRAAGATHWQTLLELLTTQLETVLRTVDTLLQNHSDTAHLDTSHAKQVLRHLNDRLNPGAANHELATPSQHTDRTHAPAQKKRYAETTATSAGTPRSHHHKTGTKPTPVVKPTLAGSSSTSVAKQ